MGFLTRWLYVASRLSGDASARRRVEHRKRQNTYLDHGGTLFQNAGGAMLRALRPGYHPNQIADPPWVDQWRLAYAAMHSDKLPLLDTSQRDIPPRF